MPILLFILSCTRCAVYVCRDSFTLWLWMSGNGICSFQHGTFKIWHSNVEFLWRHKYLKSEYSSTLIISNMVQILYWFLPKHCHADILNLIVSQFSHRNHPTHVFNHIFALYGINWIPEVVLLELIRVYRN